MHMYRDVSDFCLKARQSRSLRYSLTSLVIGTCAQPLPRGPLIPSEGLSVQALGRSQLEMRLIDGTLTSSF